MKEMVKRKVINFSEPCELPFLTAQRSKATNWRGDVSFELKNDTPYLNGKKLRFLSLKESGWSVEATRAMMELEVWGRNVSAKLLDFFKENPDLFPEKLKKEVGGQPVKIYCWEDLFEHPLHGDQYVRFAYWNTSKEEVVTGYCNTEECSLGPDDLSVVFESVT